MVKVGDDDTIVEKKMAACNYCAKEMAVDPIKNGTSGLNNHLRSCKKYPPNMDKTQALLTLQPVKGRDGESKSSSLSNWRINVDAARNALARMILVDELPFKFVDKEGFRNFLTVVCPWFHLPSRFTIRDDCYKLYQSEKLALKKFLKKSSQRVCLTTDTWTSIQKINYMCLMIHFIDNDWILNKKIINFCPISSHKGESIGMAIEACLLDWGIEKVMTITVDNASSNDVAVNYLKARFTSWNTNVMNGRFLQMRCVPHIINLVVKEGCKDIAPAIARVRNAVRYIRQSPARLSKFKQCITDERIQSKAMLCLDVPTRWNSTYLMLQSALKLRGAFSRYDQQHVEYRLDLELGADDLVNDKLDDVEMMEKGVPTVKDWEDVRVLTQFLERFYHMTIRLSASLFVTSNMYFKEISQLYIFLQKWMLNKKDAHLATMATRMKGKYDKYWGNLSKMNLLLHIATLLDPRRKWEFMNISLDAMYKKEDPLKDETMKNVKSVLLGLFNEYEEMYGNEVVQQSQETSAAVNVEYQNNDDEVDLFALQKKHKNESGCGNTLSEMDKYFGESTEDDVKEFDILHWWRINSQRFSILSHLAQDVLAIPISTVASESAFSTGGRVLDQFRSSLTPSMVEALLCTQDWLRSSSTKVDIEEDLDELEKFETDFVKVNDMLESRSNAQENIC